MKPGKYQRSKQTWQDFCLKVHNRTNFLVPMLPDKVCFTAGEERARKLQGGINQC